MKYKFTVFFIFFLYCHTLKEIPSPLKGSFENPISISGFDNVKECIDSFNKKYSIKIKHIQSVTGINFEIIDIFSFPYKKWHKVKYQTNSPIDIPDEYYFYINPYGINNECEKDLDLILEFP